MSLDPKACGLGIPGKKSFPWADGVATVMVALRKSFEATASPSCVPKRWEEHGSQGGCATLFCYLLRLLY